MCRSKELSLGEMSIARIFYLSNNNLSGTINTTFSIGNSFRAINLNDNKFTGKVPRALIECKYVTDQYTLVYYYVMTMTTKGQDYDSVRILASSMIIKE